MVALASDNFNRADTGSLGANWTDGGEAHHFIISGNKAACDVYSGGDTGGYYSGITWPNDHYSKVKITGSGTGIGGGVGWGLLVRKNAGTGTAWYRFVINHAASGNYELLKRDSGGSYTSLDVGTQAFTDGDYIELDAVGTSISAYRITTLIVSHVDSTNTTGNAGMGYSSTADTPQPTGDDWEGGDFSAGDLPPGLGPDLRMDPAMQSTQAAMMR